MTTVWLTIAALAAGTIALRSAGPVAVGGRQPSERATAVIKLIAPAVLAALVAYETFNASGGSGFHADARVAGLAAAAAALALRLPVIVVVLLAAASTALVRAVS